MGKVLSGEAGGMVSSLQSVWRPCFVALWGANASSASHGWGSSAVLQEHVSAQSTGCCVANAFQSQLGKASFKEAQIY